MAAVKIICAARAGPTSLWRVGVPAFRHRGGSVGAAMQRRGLCCHVLARPGPAWPCVVCGPGLRLLLQAAVPSTRRLLRSRHAAPWAVLPRLGRGVRSWPAPALAGSGCRAISTPRSGSNGAASLMGQLQLASLKKASCMKPARSGSVGAVSQGPAAA